MIKVKYSGIVMKCRSQFLVCLRGQEEGGLCQAIANHSYNFMENP